VGEERKTDGLLSSNAISVGGHGLRGLDLLLDDGRHLLSISPLSPSSLCIDEKEHTLNCVDWIELRYCSLVVSEAYSEDEEGSKSGTPARCGRALILTLDGVEPVPRKPAHETIRRGLLVRVSASS
jgi:hypothetical protein